MTSEEMQKAMSFILEQQAQASAKIDALADAQKDAHKQAEERWTRSEERWTRTEESIRSLLSIAEIHEREVTVIGQGIEKLTNEILNLGATTRATDDRLNVLINIVERHISEGHNGRP